MSSDGQQSAEVDILATVARSLALRAKIDEANLLALREIGERQERIEMAFMRSAAENGDEHSGATDRLDAGTVERAHIRASQSRLEKNFLQFLIEFDTFRREVRNNEPLLVWLLRTLKALGGK